MARKKKSDEEQASGGNAERGAVVFEEAMAELEETVRKLEAGDIALEESLEAFEKGVKLVRVLHRRLDAVQEKIEELSRGNAGELLTKPFKENED